MKTNEIILLDNSHSSCVWSARHVVFTAAVHI